MTPGLKSHLPSGIAEVDQVTSHVFLLSRPLRYALETPGIGGHDQPKGALDVVPEVIEIEILCGRIEKAPIGDSILWGQPSNHVVELGTGKLGIHLAQRPSANQDGLGLDAERSQQDDDQHALVLAVPVFSVDDLIR